MDRLKSRKFIMAVVAAVLLVVVDGLGIELDTDTITGFVGVVVGYLVSQGYVDGKQ